MKLKPLFLLLAALVLFFAGCQKSPAEKAAEKEAKSDAISKQLMGQ